VSIWDQRPELIVQLIQLWEEGVTTAEIGRRLGITKNQALGKIHRLGLDNRVEPKSKPVLTARNALEHLEPGTCIWPTGDPQKPGFNYCGASPLILDKPYCGQHVAIAYLRQVSKSASQQVGFSPSPAGKSHRRKP